MGVAEKRLIVMEMRYLGSMCGVTLMDRVTNEEVQKRTDVGCGSRKDDSA